MPTGTERLNDFTRVRREQARTVDYITSRDELLGTKLRFCATWIIYREYLDHGGEARLRHVNFCTKYTLCRLCAKRRSVKLVEAYEPKVEAVIEAAAKEGRELVPVLISLTLASGWNLGERIEHYKDAHAAMLAAKRKGASTSGNHAPIEWNKVEGALRSVEATFSDEHGWHVHAHVYALLGSYIDVYRLSAEWERFTGDSRIVDVRKCHGERRAALYEAIKYTCKFSGLTDARLWEFHQGVNGSRMFDPSGCLRGVRTGDLDQDKPLDGAYRDYLAIWNLWERKYELKAVPEILSCPRVRA